MVQQAVLKLPLLACLLVAPVTMRTPLASLRRKCLLTNPQTLKNGDGDKKALALKEFLSVINQRTDAPKSHLEVGLLYLDPAVDPDPFSAIYHFKKYLDYVPDPKVIRFAECRVDKRAKQCHHNFPVIHIKPKATVVCI